MTFNDLDLHETVRQGLKDVGFTKPTPIQEQSIPHALEGKDVLGAAQTGTGKTGAFVIPILENILRNPAEGTKVLILSPTRELAQQIDEQIFALGYHTGISSALVIGGEDFGKQANAIRAGVDIIIATPGRLIDQIKVLSVDFSNIRVLVLDEADRMLDMGFLPDVKSIIDRLPKERQTMLFSATMPPELQKLMKSVMHDPVSVQIEVSTTSKKVTQQAYFTPPRKKLGLVQHILSNEEWKSCIIFSATKKGTSQLEELLNKNGVKANSIHGDKTQEERSRALLDFKNGKVPVIVATDVLSRGIDIDNVSIIINYDVPRAVEDYIHRIGRTGRYDKEGTAVTLVSRADEKYFEPIQKKIGDKITILDTDKALDESEKEPRRPAAEKQGRQSSAAKPETADDSEVLISKDAAGKVVVTLKSKNEPEQAEKTGKKNQEPEKEKTEPKSKDKRAKQQEHRHSDSKKAGRKAEKPKSEGRETDETFIMPDRIERAVEHNRRRRRPAKGLWGVIKSMIPGPDRG